MDYKKSFWTKLSKEFNAYTEKSSYDRPRTIQIEHTGFFPNHIGHRGLNHNESSLLDFGTRIIEADSVHFAYNRRFNGVSLYIRSTVHSYDSGTYLEFTRNGKTVQVTLYDNADKTPWQIEQVLGEVSVDLFQTYNLEEFKNALTKAGCNILVFFRFNTQISLRIPHMLPSIGTPSYVKLIKQGIEIGWIASGTYNSLPNVIRVKRITSIQTVKLSELGIENKGYYSHDWKCYIPKTQARKAKAFFTKRFDTLKG